jgi:hypothetical protein
MFLRVHLLCSRSTRRQQNEHVPMKDSLKKPDIDCGHESPERYAVYKRNSAHRLIVP